MQLFFFFDFLLNLSALYHELTGGTWLALMGIQSKLDCIPFPEQLLWVSFDELFSKHFSAIRKNLMMICLIDINKKE